MRSFLHRIEKAGGGGKKRKKEETQPLTAVVPTWTNSKESRSLLRGKIIKNSSGLVGHF